MNKPIEFDMIKRRNALNLWRAECKRRMGLRFPKIDFDADYWPIKTLYQTSQGDWYFTEPFADFAEKDESYRDVLRCLVAEFMIAGKPKSIDYQIHVFRPLATASAHRLFDLTLSDLRKIEEDSLILARANPSSANKIRNAMNARTTLIVKLAAKGVLPRIGFNVSVEAKTELSDIVRCHFAARRKGRGDLLNTKMEAFNDAMNALIDNDSRLDAHDKVVICAIIRDLCAPSRINEVLCSSIDDHVTIEDYAQKSCAETSDVLRAHQMLLVTMKGSKGAQWSAKPILKFMIDAFHYATGVILEHGKRSRMLVKWYQKYPAMLYLPPELEYMRGQDLSAHDLAKIIYMTGNLPSEARNSSPRRYFNELKSRIFKAPNPNSHQINGCLVTRPMIDFLPWAAIEELLLKKVHQAMVNCRKVTSTNHYEGDLSKMLFLFDRDTVPFLPYATSYGHINKRLKRSTTSSRKKDAQPSIFEKLGISMPVNGRIQVAEIDTHDPRRWLTTMALTYGEKLSDALVNKWANRSRLSQIKYYDFRTAENLAEFSAMPEISELTDLSMGLDKAHKLENEFGLKTTIVTVHDAGISMTSMDHIAQAIDDRPIARTSHGIIIIYPQRYGICFHQHHETPCRNYSNSCVTCDDGGVVKGHIPTNDAVRNRNKILVTSIVRHLENLAYAHNRHVADDQDALGEHMLALIKQGLNSEPMEEVATQLIREFHEIKHLIKDKLLANRLHEAFVANGYVQILDDPEVANGALLKYHNATQHAAPGLEIALDSHGGRDQVARDEQTLIERFPQFAPKAMGLKDERHLLEADDDEERD
ncbi:hypothetical protein CFter6_2875 [Collimonas fungivorans]|uniref:Uncharacterized protein n=1 Tax=Collimonas fungivorans TaxID=158899 RepID=A0A127PDM3_9BURK|nr:hypothetical protein [Collimonas fungivorans]AMO95541.1 hypothetical protein CFter6_2875 [Collimonas fungivorans]